MRNLTAIFLTLILIMTIFGCGGSESFIEIEPPVEILSGYCVGTDSWYMIEDCASCH